MSTSVRCLDEILQRIQLLVVNDADVVELIVYRTVRQLQQLARQRGGVQRQHIAVRVGEQHIPFHLPVQLPKASKPQPAFSEAQPSGNAFTRTKQRCVP